MKVLFCGCIYGAGNIGDDAILSGLLKSFEKSVPEAELGVISYNPAKTKGDFALQQVWGLSFRDTVSAFRWATHIVLGGATLISENPTIRYPLQHCCYLIDFAIWWNKPISMLAAGASNIRTDKARKLLKKYYENELDLITVRSQFDLEQATIAGGLSGERLKIAADAAFSMPFLENNGQSAEYVGVSFVDEKMEGDTLIVRLREELKTFLEAAGIQPVGICSETRVQEYMDVSTIRNVFRGLIDQAVIYEDYHTCEQFFERLCSCQLVVTMRMHVVVFCALLGIPCVALVREQKIESMLRELGLPKGVSMSFEPGELTKKLIHAHQNPQEYIVDPKKLNELRNRALQNAVYWREYYSVETVRRHPLLKRACSMMRSLKGVVSKIGLRVYWRVTKYLKRSS